MYPLAILSFIACVIFLERFLYLHRGKIRAIEFVSGIKAALKKKHLLEAIASCKCNRHKSIFTLEQTSSEPSFNCENLYVSWLNGNNISAT